LEQIELHQNSRRGIALFISGLAFFVIGEALVKLLHEDYGTTQIVWSRYFFHFVLTCLFLSRGSLFNQARSSRPWLHVARSLLMLIATACFFAALQFLALADAIAIAFLAPLLVTAFSIPILGETVGWRRWLAIIIGFGGVMVIIRPGAIGTHWAMFLPLVSAVCYAVYQILTRIAARTDHANTSLFWTSVIGVSVTSFLVPFDWNFPDTVGWIYMVSLGASYGIGHYLLIRGLEIAPASVVSPFLYTQVIFAAFLGLAIFDEFPDAWTLLGLAIVVCSGLYIWRREIRVQGDLKN
jgi:drug/metabolite transporter (DMT)-like permease